MTNLEERAASNPFSWRESQWAANGWLLFLLFPLISIIGADLATGRKVVGYALIAAFVVLHVAAYGAMAAREAAALGQIASPGFWGPINPMPYFVLLSAVTILGVAAVSPAMLGLMPFLVVFGVFNFSWTAAIAIGVVCTVAAIVVPLAFDLFPELAFFAVIVFSTGAGAAFTRISEQVSLDQSALRTELAVSDERNRVARDVHDVLGHSLTAAILKTQVCSRLLETIVGADEEDRETIAHVKAELAELETVSRRSMAEIRSTVGGLRVANLVDELAAAKAVLADAEVDLAVHGDVTAVAAEYETVLAWVVRESVTNVVRHARAATCAIEFPSTTAERADNNLLMCVIDDGVGFDNTTIGNGIRGMRERLLGADLDLVISSTGDRGTRIEVLA